MVLAIYAVWCFAVAFAGGLVGLVLGNIRLPATLLVATSAAAGTGANLIASATAAAAASIAHIRAGRVNWRLFAWMAPPSIVFGFVGGYVSGEMPRDVLLGFISVVLLVSGFQLLGWQPRPTAGGDESPRRGRRGRPRVPADRHGAKLDLRAAVTSGAIVGFLGGVVGLILGSLRMPALLRLVGEAPARAAGTNVTVGFLVGVAGAVGHLPSAPPDWTVAAVGAAASIPGALLGSRLTGRLSEAQLIRAIAIVLLVTAAATGVEAIVG